MRAVLCDLGIIDSRNDILTISVIMGTNSAMHFFSSQVSNGSSSQENSLMDSIIMDSEKSMPER